MRRFSDISDGQFISETSDGRYVLFAEVERKLADIRSKWEGEKASLMDWINTFAREESTEQCHDITADLRDTVAEIVYKLRRRIQAVRRLADETHMAMEVEHGYVVDAQAELARLSEIVDRLPHKDDIELAIRANNLGGLEFKQDYCQCDPDVGCSPCPYCAIDSLLTRLLSAAEQAKEKA